jgi:UDP:flavonoid glycosyltransferase YjiC (YdhE family)
MGTVVTGDDAEHGWAATSGSAITGRQMCQSVYRAVFAELGAAGGAGDAESALIVVSLGPQPGALEGVAVPGNALCAPSVPQVDLLRAGRPALFVTNGGQNSLMESMTVGTPVIVCPGFGDQLANAAKVLSQEWGVKVDRPQPDADAEPADASAGYEAAVRSAVREVLAGEQFAARAREIAAGLEQAEGVDGAVRVMLAAASGTATAKADM